LIANHASHFDSLTVLTALPEGRRRKTAVAAAADYFFEDGWMAFVASLLLGAFPFHRTGPVAASLAHCGDLADTGHSLLVFPEGTRSTTGQIAPFKPGIGLLARELGLPVVPIYIDGLFKILPKGRTFPRPGPVRVVVGFPRQIDPARSNAEAAAEIERSVRALAQSVGYLHAGPNGKYRCRCCGYYILDEMATGTYEICHVCFWEDDPVQDYDPDYADGANKPSLNEARRNFKQFGACERRLLEHVRPPRDDERPPADSPWPMP
jgi:1-acyl-sn-glycerol-3-phosphate acyltransferase